MIASVIILSILLLFFICMFAIACIAIHDLNRLVKNYEDYLRHSDELDNIKMYLREGNTD